MIKTFPPHIFPRKLQHHIRSLMKYLGFPQDYISASIIVAVATAIGKTIKIKIKTSWVESPIIFLCLVGRPGANKSHPLTMALNPLMDITMDDLLGKNSTKDMFTWESMFSTEVNGEAPKVKGQMVINKATIEAIFQQMQIGNPRHIIWIDELSGLIKNFARYNKGSDVEYFLSLFSGFNIIINLKTQETTVIKNPFTCITGTIQPSVLKSLYKILEGNGFFDRFLFVWPEDDTKGKMITEDLPIEIVTEYNEIIKKLLGLQMVDGESTIISFTEAAYSEAMDWYNSNADLINESDEKLAGVYSKLDNYFFRLALIIQLMRWACGEAGKDAVDLESVKRAKDLIEYFRFMGEKVLRISTSDPIDGMTDLQRNVYQNLSEEFTTSNGVRYASEKGMSERAFKYFLNNTLLFKRLKVGRYKKLF